MTTPYYQGDGITLYHGDCRVLVEWTDADVLVTDPPYGIGWTLPAYNGGKPHEGIEGDVDAGARDAALALFGSPKPKLVFGSPTAPPPSGVRWSLVYQKPPDTGLMGAVGGFRRDWEIIYLMGNWPRTVARQSSVLRTSAPSLINLVADRYPKDRGTGHPHTKPLDVMEKLVGACPPGLVADPFAGSGSTLLAARMQGRRAIGVEIEERYCEVIARRLDQGDLFGGAS